MKLRVHFYEIFLFHLLHAANSSCNFPTLTINATPTTRATLPTCWSSRVEWQQKTPLYDQGRLSVNLLLVVLWHELWIFFFTEILLTGLLCMSVYLFVCLLIFCSGLTCPTNDPSPFFIEKTHFVNMWPFVRLFVCLFVCLLAQSLTHLHFWAASVQLCVRLLQYDCLHTSTYLLSCQPI